MGKAERQHAKQEQAEADRAKKAAKADRRREREAEWNALSAKQKRPAKIVAGVLAGLALVAIGWAVVSGGETTDNDPAPASEEDAPNVDASPSEPEQPAGDGFTAEILCEQAIEEGVGADLDFSSQEHRPAADNAHWVVSGTVQNQAGERTDYRCNMQNTSGDEWVPLDIFVAE